MAPRTLPQVLPFPGDPLLARQPAMAPVAAVDLRRLCSAVGHVYDAVFQTAAWKNIKQRANELATGKMTASLAGGEDIAARLQIPGAAAEFLGDLPKVSAAIKV